MGRWRLKPVRLLASDLDGTLVGDRHATLRFKTQWEAINPVKRPLLVYNSGRLVEDIEALIEVTDLPKPDHIIGGVGTMIAGSDYGQLYSRTLGAPFDRALIARLLDRMDGISLQADRFQHPHKSSWHLHNADDDTIADIERQLIRAGLDVKLVYSSDRDLDILPRAADKGAALAWLAARLGIDLDEVVVAGDTGNDRDMFLVENVRGIVVGNALPELRRIASAEKRHYQAEAHTADGVIEGLRHWGVIV